MASQPRWEMVPSSEVSLLRPVVLDGEWKAPRRKKTLADDDGVRMVRGLLVGVGLCAPFWALVVWIIIRVAGR
jgi:hypothetical protein